MRRVGGIVSELPRASVRVHSRYRRRLADLAIAGRRVLIRLMVRRFFCTDASCDRKIFAEQIGLASRYARRTDLAGGVLETVVLALGGRPGARMTDALEVPVNRMTLLLIIRRIPDRPVQAPQVLGVDDFAIKKGQNYATYWTFDVVGEDMPVAVAESSCPYIPIWPTCWGRTSTRAAWHEGGIPEWLHETCLVR